MEQFIPLFEFLFKSGAYESDLKRLFQEPLIKMAVNRGLVSAKTDKTWQNRWPTSHEYYFEITSNGILEYNLLKKRCMKNGTRPVSQSSC